MKSIVASLICSACLVSAEDNLKAFPPAEEGMTRHVLTLAKEKNEADLKVEIIIGKMMKTDTVNQYTLGGKIEVVPVEGWGFERYVLRKIGPPVQTLMAPLADAPMVDRFVSIGGEPFIVRYNSKLPIVVYVPEGVEVRHRIWRADPETKDIPQG